MSDHPCHDCGAPAKFDLCDECWQQARTQTLTRYLGPLIRRLEDEQLP